MVLVFAAAVLYAATLDNGLQTAELLGGDLITHQYAQVQARPSNAPGYPLFTMGGWAWFHGIRSIMARMGLSQPNPIPILSSYSTLWAILSLWLLYEIVCTATESARRPSGNWPLALLIGLFYSVTYFFWYYATTTEQYSSAIAHTLGILLVFMLWLRQRENLALLYLLALLCGISLAHMLTVAFIVPPVVAAVLWANPSLVRRPKAVIGSIAAALIPLLSYAFVYVRGSRHPEWWGSQQFDSPSHWFWTFIGTAQGREELLWAFEPGRPFLGNGFPTLIEQELSGTILLAGIVGILFLRKPLPFVLYATLTIYAVFSWAYRFGNWYQVILPAYALILIGVGALADRWQTYAYWHARSESAGRRPTTLRTLLSVSPLLLLAVAIIWRFDASLPTADSRDRPDDSGLDRPAVLLDSRLPQGSAVFASVEDALGLQYLSRVWGLRPDVRVVSSQEAGTMLADTPVFATWDAAPTLASEIGDDKQIQKAVVSPDWVMFLPEDGSPSGPEVFQSRSGFIVVDRQISDDVELAGYAVHPAPTGAPVIEAAGPSDDVTLYWRLPQGDWPHGLSVSVRPTVDDEFVADPDNPGGIVQSDRVLPAQLQVVPGQSSDAVIIPDPFRLRFPEAATQEDLGIAVILYRATDAGFENVARLDLPLAARSLLQE